MPDAEHDSKDWNKMLSNIGVFGSVSQSSAPRARSRGRGRSFSSSNHSKSPSVPISTSLFNHFSNTLSYIEVLLIQLCDVNELSHPALTHQCLDNVIKLLFNSSSKPSNLPTNIISLPVKNTVMSYLPRLLSHFETSVRAKAFKILPYIIIWSQIHLFRTYFELVIVKALLNSDKAIQEADLALKFLRLSFSFTYLYSESLPEPIQTYQQESSDISSRDSSQAEYKPLSFKIFSSFLDTNLILRVLISIAEQPENKLRNVVIETLCELLLLSPRNFVANNGLKVLITSALDGPYHISISVISSIQHFIDDPENRPFILLNFEFEPLLAPITLHDSSSKISQEQENITVYMFSQFFKSWSGLVYIVSADCLIIKSILSSFENIKSHRVAILGLLFEIFGLSGLFDATRNLQNIKSFQVINQINKIADLHGKITNYILPLPHEFRQIIYFRSIILTLFIHCGLFKSLVIALYSETDHDTSEAISMLITWLIYNPLTKLQKSSFKSIQSQLDYIINKSANIKITELEISKINLIFHNICNPFAKFLETSSPISLNSKKWIYRNLYNNILNTSYPLDSFSAKNPLFPKYFIKSPSVASYLARHSFKRSDSNLLPHSRSSIDLDRTFNSNSELHSNNNTTAHDNYIENPLPLQNYKHFNNFLTSQTEYLPSRASFTFDNSLGCLPDSKVNFEVGSYSRSSSLNLIKHAPNSSLENSSRKIASNTRNPNRVLNYGSLGNIFFNRQSEDKKKIEPDLKLFPINENNDELKSDSILKSFMSNSKKILSQKGHKTESHRNSITQNLDTQTNSNSNNNITLNSIINNDNVVVNATTDSTTVTKINSSSNLDTTNITDPIIFTNSDLTTNHHVNNTTNLNTKQDINFEINTNTIKNSDHVVNTSYNTNLNSNFTQNQNILNSTKSNLPLFFGYLKSPVSPISIPAKSSNLFGVNSSSKQNLQFNQKGNIPSAIVIQQLALKKAKLKSLLGASLVLQKEKYTDWNWKVINQLLFDHDLLENKLLNELITDSLFLHRLATFYMPSGFGFCGMPSTDISICCSDAGIQFIKVLMSSGDGMLFIDECNLVNDIVFHLSQLIRPLSSFSDIKISKKSSIASFELNPKSNSCFLYSNIVFYPTTKIYFNMLNELRKSKGGMKLLEHQRLFDVYFNLLDSKEDINIENIIKYILNSINCDDHGYGRLFVQKLAASPVESYLKQIFPYLFDLATNRYNYLCVSKPQFVNKQNNILDWALSILIRLLTCPYRKIAQASIQTIVLVFDYFQRQFIYVSNSTAYKDHWVIDLFLSKNPNLILVESDVLRPLLLKLASFDSGVAYMISVDLLDPEMERWKEDMGINYVYETELKLEKELLHDPLFCPAVLPGSNTTSSKHVHSASNESSMLIPSAMQMHLFGQLSFCQAGVKILYDHEIFSLLIETLENIDSNCTSRNDILALKATLYAIGSVGVSDFGGSVLQKSGIIPKLIDQLKKSQRASIKGSIIFTLARMSRNESVGRELKNYSWDLCYTLNDQYEYAMPKNLKEFLGVSGWQQDSILNNILDDSSIIHVSSAFDYKKYEFDHNFEFDIEARQKIISKYCDYSNLDSVKIEILSSICSMTSHMLITESCKNLMKLRASHPHYFRIVHLFEVAIQIMASFKFRFSTLRFIFGLFDINPVNIFPYYNNDLNTPAFSSTFNTPSPGNPSI
ncbi:hypothetical protein BB561_003733 [Smittium simulii]|uniref:Uncharacterized protein n=1 Tax=Smittium simulii TaxID=133385 RepID=A0A2T9YJZ4_9FUNG|nr:hypothetical protein BB561_003733 [Smittium simulii]